MGLETTYAEEIVLLHSRSCLFGTYLKKRTRFGCWCDLRCILPTTSLLSDILDCIQELKHLGLLLSSIRVHLEATWLSVP